MSALNFKINLDHCPKERGEGEGGGGEEEELSGGVLVKVICGFKLSQYDDVLRIQLFNASSIREIIPSSGRPCHLSIIPLKDSHLFKIAESVISFCFKKFLT